MSLRTLSSLLVLTVGLYLVLIHQTEAKEPKIDEKSTKDAEDLFSRTENVIEEHEHNIDKNTNKDKENVIHESATDDFPHISDTYDSYQVDESKEDNGSDKEIEQNVDFSEVPDHNQPLQGSNMEDPSQHVPQPQHINKEEDHNSIEIEDDSLDDKDDISKSTFLDKASANMENIERLSDNNLNKDFDNSAISKENTDKMAPDEYNSQDEIPNVDNAPTESNIEAMDIGGGESEGLDEGFQMPDYTETEIKENEQGSKDMEVKHSESPNEYDLVDGNENVDPPEKEESNEGIQDSIISDGEGGTLKERPLDTSSSDEEVSPIGTNKEEATKTEDSQAPDNRLVDDFNADKKSKKRESESKSDSLNDGEDNDAKVMPGAELWEEAEKLLNQSKKSHKKAYKLLAGAAELNHTKAMETASSGYLLADYLPRNVTKSIEMFQKLADKGSLIGQQGLGFIFGTGTGAKSSQAKALIYTTFAALGGGIMAQMMLGYRYWGGIGVVQNCETALTHYKKVSKQVAQTAQPMGTQAVHRIRLYDELEQGSSGGNLDDDLLQYYQFLADKGDVQAQVGLGQLYFQGARGVDVDHEKAFQYFKQAADAGNANAQAYLGKMYLEGGSNVEQNNETAFEYFKKAVEQGNPIGHSGLGLIYLRGKGIAKDYGKAVNHFNIAAEQGWPEAQLQLGNIYYHGLGVSRDYQKAVKYFTLASQSGNLLAVYNLASMHAGGNGVLRSCHTATELFKSVAERGKWSSWFTEAYAAYKGGDIDTALIKYYLLAELGYEAAQSNVAYILEKGESTMYAKNETFARALLQWSRAASQGYTVARVKVGDYHFYGWGTTVDYEIAALHYRLASEQQNNAQAMFNLGYMHEQGLGLKKDIHLAKRFYDMAAESNPDAQVPVALAMVKLGAYFTLEWARKHYKFWERFDIKEILGKDWDLYVITALAILLGLILLIRRTQA